MIEFYVSAMIIKRDFSFDLEETWRVELKRSETSGGMDGVLSGIDRAGGGKR